MFCKISASHIACVHHLHADALNSLIYSEMDMLLAEIHGNGFHQPDKTCFYNNLKRVRDCLIWLSMAHGVFQENSNRLLAVLQLSSSRFQRWKVQTFKSVSTTCLEVSKTIGPEHAEV